MPHLREEIISSSESDREKLFDRLYKKSGNTFKKSSEKELYLLALIEAVNNAAEHGNNDIAEKTIKINYFFLKNISGISISDEGPGFNPVFPDLKNTKGKRGRGLGFIKTNSDAVFFNRTGNQITFFKGCCSMDQESQNAKAKSSIFPRVTVLITDLELKNRNNISNGLAEIFANLGNIKPKKILIDLKQVRVLSSMTWGTIFSEAEENTELILLFNVNKAIQETAKQIGLNTRKGIYSKIKLFEDNSEVLKILAGDI